MGKIVVVTCDECGKMISNTPHSGALNIKQDTFCIPTGDIYINDWVICSWKCLAELVKKHIEMK
jgi:hypothetical protein